MADLNGGIIGKENEIVTQPEVITTFNSSGTFTTTSYTSEVQYLVIAGGGGGGDAVGGGGGAGGYRTATGFPVFAIPSTIFFVHLGSMPITITAATLGLLPVPIIVLKCNSRSAPNCNLP